MDLSLLVALVALPVSDAMTPAQCRAARGLLNWTQDKLAAARDPSAARR
jgi:hypothetical protein